jgi:hypothetical protein
MRGAVQEITVVVAMLLATSALAADPGYIEGQNIEDGCCRNWQEDPALSDAPRHGVIHGGFLPVYRGGCWRWWYDQWVWVC